MEAIPRSGPLVSTVLAAEVNYLRLAKSLTTPTPNVALRRVAQAAVVVLGALGLAGGGVKAGGRCWSTSASSARAALPPVYLMWAGVADTPPWLGGTLAFGSLPPSCWWAALA